VEVGGDDRKLGRNRVFDWQKTVFKKVEGLDKDVKEIKQNLNKITPENQRNIKKILLKKCQKSLVVCDKVVGLLCRQAFTQPKYVEMYS